MLAAIDRAGAGGLAVERDARSVSARTRHRRGRRRCWCWSGALYGVSLLRGRRRAGRHRTAQARRGLTARPSWHRYRAAGRPVFVDATAAWCITCLVNEDAVLSRADVKSAFAGKNVVYMVADWTNQNPEITALLKDNGRSGVPLYLYYAPGAAKADVLPQILTEAGVLAADRLLDADKRLVCVRRLGVAGLHFLLGILHRRLARRVAASLSRPVGAPMA